MKQGTVEEIAERIFELSQHSIVDGEVKAAIVEALRNEREAERDRITSAMMKMYWHFDCTSERDIVLAIPHLPSCTCLAKDNQEATEFQHHHNSCPVYIRVAAIRRGDR